MSRQRRFTDMFSPAHLVALSHWFDAQFAPVTTARSSPISQFGIFGAVGTSQSWVAKARSNNDSTW
jgi:hypothetical protein